MGNPLSIPPVIDPQWLEANNLPSGQAGIYVVEVSAGGPAQKAGLLGSSSTIEIDDLSYGVGGDVILGLDGNPVITMEELVDRLSAMQPGQRIVFTILRDGIQMEIEVILAEWPDDLATPTPETTE